MMISGTAALNQSNVISNQARCYGSYQYFCSICQQRFQSEKSFRRHNNSRKHIRQAQISDSISCKPGIARNNSADSMKLSLLSSDVIETLVGDMIDDIQSKNDFFNGIRLVNENDVDLTAECMLSPNVDANIQNSMEDTPIYRPKEVELARIPAIYPCSTCFQLLDSSQKNFNEHMLKVHFHYSIGVEKKI